MYPGKTDGNLSPPIQFLYVSKQCLSDIIEVYRWHPRKNESLTVHNLSQLFALIFFVHLFFSLSIEMSLYSFADQREKDKQMTFKEANTLNKQQSVFSKSWPFLNRVTLMILLSVHSSSQERSQSV